jgi:protein-S-isoprenylcysteine O-methyltransferase Ste14
MSDPADLNGSLWKEIIPRIVTGMLGLVGFTVVWFGIAGRVTWWQGWAFLLTFLVYVGILGWRLSKVDPDLMRERNRPADQAEAWDRAVMGVYSVVLVILLVVAALDGGRYLWSTIPLGVQMIGWALLVLAGIIVWQVMMTNAYLSSWARIQADRGQVVVQEGWYRWMRHPMYLGIILSFLGIPLMLNSCWAMIPGFVIVGLFVYRTYREDQMLIENLAGYAEYTQKVRFRLLPGVW